MGSGFRYVPNWRGGRELMNCRKMQDGLMDIATRVRAAAQASGAEQGAEYEADVREGRERAHAMVKTTNYAAERESAKRNTLLKSLSAGR